VVGIFTSWYRVHHIHDFITEFYENQWNGCEVICIGQTHDWRRYEGVSKSFRTGRLERELQMAHLSATRCSCIAILWVSLVSFATITICVASQRAILKVSVNFVIDSVRKLLDTPSYASSHADAWRISQESICVFPWHAQVFRKRHLQFCIPHCLWWSFIAHKNLSLQKGKR
jgi:hypothetical protein